VYVLYPNDIVQSRREWGSGNARDTTTPFPSKNFFWAKLIKIWANLVRFGQNCGEIWAKVIRFWQI